MQIKLSFDAAPAQWGDNANISYQEQSITLHVNSTGNIQRDIQTSGRQLAKLNLEHLEIVGENWCTETQWSLIQGYLSPKNQSLITWCENEKSDLKELENRFEISRWTRDLVNKTPEDQSPVILCEDAAEFLEGFAPGQITYEIIEGEALEEEGLVGIWNVGRGSVRPPALLRLEFCPEGMEDADYHAALVGKGITYDSGGYSIKSSQGMLCMKGDMGGAATVVGGLALAISRGYNKRIALFLCCAENLISGHAYKLGDILTYKNGTTVEIVNTDAEGRIVLADGLMLASETEAPLIIDAATLTGAAMVAVGAEYNALLSMDDELANRALQYAQQENEGLWRLPLNDWHQNMAPSYYADTANSRPVKGGGAGGASIAAGFLSRFLPNPQQGWLHLDLAQALNANDEQTLAAGGTAVGVRTIARILLEEQ
jgi:PepB aminopeptidase